MKKSIWVYLSIFVVMSGILSDSCKKEEVPVLTTAEISNIAFTTAISGGNIIDEGSSSVIVRGVCWSTTAKPKIADNKTTDSTGAGSFVSGITGLTPNTNYFVRAYAANGSGTGYGMEMSFTTQQAILPEITTKDVTFSYEIISTGLRYCGFTGGTIISDGGKPVIAQGVCWSTNQSPTILDETTSDSTGVGSFSSRIIGLLRLTTYYVRAYATNSLGTAYGNQVSFTSPCLIYPYSAMNIYLSDPGNGAFGQPLNPTLSWENRHSPGSYYVDGRYDVYIGTSPDPTTKIDPNLIQGGTGLYSIAISGLDSNTFYYWKIIGWEYSYPCNSDTSDIWHFTTGGPIAPEVSTIIIPGYTYTSATVGGCATCELAVTITECGVYWGTSQNPESTGTKLQIGSGTGSFSTSLSGLNPNTTYYVKAYATNSVGTAYGNQVSFNTGQNTTISTISDIEGNVYHIVTIGTQVWMAENLKTTKYNDGTTIPLVTDNNAWGNLTTPGYCWYNNDEATYKATYGALYNWFTVNTSKLCPTGWHVSTDAEWTTLTTYLGGESVAGGKLKETGTAHWTSPNTGATNESGFTALPGGDRIYNGAFYAIGSYGWWWSATENDATTRAWLRQLHNVNVSISRSITNSYKTDGFSIRCLRD